MKVIAAIALSAAAVFLAVGCGTSHAAPPRPAPPAAAQVPALPAPARQPADCARLSTSPLPLAGYDQMVIRELNLITAGGNASRADVRAARAKVAARVAASCPQFSYLAKEEDS